MRSDGDGGGGSLISPSVSVSLSWSHIRIPVIFPGEAGDHHPVWVRQKASGIPAVCTTFALCRAFVVVLVLAAVSSVNIEFVGSEYSR